MRVGVISEGPADFAVVRSIVKAVLGLDEAEVDSIRPDLQSDETSTYAPSSRAFSNWEIVKQECAAGTSIRAYLTSIVEEPRLVVVHIDTAECHLPAFGVERPAKDADSYVVDCRGAVSSALRGWRSGDHAERIVDAVAVEETDAWLIPIYDAKLDQDRDSGTIGDPKAHLQRALRRTNELSDRDRARLDQQSTLARYKHLSAPLRRPKRLLEVAARNRSLKLFVEDLCAAAERLSPGACTLVRAEPRT